MVKIIDLDKLFDNYISGYVYKNIGKIKPEEIENKMPVMYEEFGNEKLKELDGETPNSYYKKFSTKELLECLKTHLKEGVSVSDFLCEAITFKKEEDVLLSVLDGEEEEFTLYVMNILNEINSEKCLSKYLEFVLYDYSEPIRELATEFLSSKADKVKDKILEVFGDAEDNKKVNLTEILASSSKDDKVFEILISEFEKHTENIPLYSGYLSKYGDEKALPYLNEAINKDKISYADFEELRFAIESLGGECTVEKDFSLDKTYKKIKGIRRKILH